MNRTRDLLTRSRALYRRATAPPSSSSSSSSSSSISSSSSCIIIIVIVAVAIVKLSGIESMMEGLESYDPNIHLDFALHISESFFFSYINEYPTNELWAVC